jgi:hypothetical protein
MDVIGHEAISINIERMFHARSAQCIQKKSHHMPPADNRLAILRVKRYEIPVPPNVGLWWQAILFAPKHGHFSISSSGGFTLPFVSRPWRHKAAVTMPSSFQIERHEHRPDLHPVSNVYFATFAHWHYYKSGGPYQFAPAWHKSGRRAPLLLFDAARTHKPSALCHE